MKLANMLDRISSAIAKFKKLSEEDCLELFFQGVTNFENESWKLDANSTYFKNPNKTNDDDPLLFCSYY